MEFKYPVTRRENIVDEIHGRKIEDPYRWLENSESPEVMNWVDEQNRLSQAVLDEYRGKETITKELYSLVEFDNIQDYSFRVVKTPKGQRFFYLFRRTDQAQPTLCYQDGEGGERMILFDPNKESEEALIAIDWFNVSHDGSLVAFGVSEGGTEQSVLHVINVETRELLNERIPRTKWCELVWVDNIGFYYSRYPLPNTVSAEDEHYYHHVYYHKLGEDYHDDVKIFGENRVKTEHPVLFINDDSTLLAVCSTRFISNDIHIARIDKENPSSLKFDSLIESDSSSSIPNFDGDLLYVDTQLDAPNGKIIRYDLSKFKRDRTIPEPTTIVKEGEGVIFSQMTMPFVLFQGNIAVIEDKNASSSLKVYDTNSGKLVDDVDFGTHVTLVQITSAPGLDKFYYSRGSFFYPTTYYRYEKQRTYLIHKPNLSLSPDDYKSELVWFESKDGTKVSMFILSKKGVTISEKTPVLLMGYGGFGISMTPGYLASRILWVKYGGIVAIPHLRGGGEYGLDWHRAGNRENKQNVFDDFNSAAEWLIQNRIGSRETLAIRGRSNGGLLVGAALVQRPDLYKAVTCGVPLLDMLRYTNFQVAKTWSTEYGDPKVEEEFEWLYSYSPYHHVKEGVRYPATLLDTALGDTRVDPMHAFKMAARLQNNSEQIEEDAPLLLHVQKQAGHGVGLSIEKTIENTAMLITFIAHHTGLVIEKG